MQAVDGRDGHRYFTTQPGSYVVPVGREVTGMEVSTYDATYRHYVARTALYAVVGTASVRYTTQEINDFKCGRKE